MTCLVLTIDGKEITGYNSLVLKPLFPHQGFRDIENNLVWSNEVVNKYSLKISGTGVFFWEDLINRSFLVEPSVPFFSLGLDLEKKRKARETVFVDNKECEKINLITDKIVTYYPVFTMIMKDFSVESDNTLCRWEVFLEEV